MDVRQETCDVDTNIMEKTVNIKEEDCQWESIYLKQESLSINEENSELPSVDIKEEPEETSVSIETHNHTNLDTAKDDNLHDGCQDGVVTRVDSSQSRHSSTPEPSTSVKSESLESEPKRAEETTSVRTQKNKRPATKKSGKMTQHVLDKECYTNVQEQDKGSDPSGISWVSILIPLNNVVQSSTKLRLQTTTVVLNYCNNTQTTGRLLVSQS
ncbi:uncharacterized protein LOC120520389 isoform X2 [Polypterus senegalus]|uniref:uncharacterized protein LOC120520389 isoform X2 n=1 Tax=Polypterus senegalus TaxID=55291 RepID=UPI00196580DB|nr:uncharacterized protein LOC120520389 isoform X2 [Polypterus senegalus]